jgi:putative endonuclease
MLYFNTAIILTLLITYFTTFTIMAKHNTTGHLGEKLASNFILQNGYIILHTNWRFSHWEVDVIASKNEVLHFFEVKTRTSKKFGNPEDKVGNKKIQNLINAAEEYLHLFPQWNRIQFNIVSVLVFKNQPAEFFLIEDVT